MLQLLKCCHAYRWRIWLVKVQSSNSPSSFFHFLLTFHFFGIDLLNMKYTPKRFHQADISFHGKLFTGENKRWCNDEAKIQLTSYNSYAVQTKRSNATELSNVVKHHFLAKHNKVNSSNYYQYHQICHVKDKNDVSVIVQYKISFRNLRFSVIQVVSDSINVAYRNQCLLFVAAANNITS